MTPHHASGGVFSCGNVFNISSIFKIIFPTKEIITPNNIAIGAHHEATSTLTPPSINTGTIIAIRIFAKGDASDSNPEKYIVYGNINSGTHSANMTSSRIAKRSGKKEKYGSIFGSTNIIKSVASTDK